MSQGPLCPNLTKRFQAEVSQMANHNLSCVMLLGGLSVNLNHLIRFKKGLPAPVTVIMYATFPEIMTIDQARNVRLEIKDKFAQRRERS